MLYEAYISLARNFPAQCDGLYGQQLDGASDCWLAVDVQAFPSFLLKAQSSDARSDIELRFVSVQFSRECEIATTNGSPARAAYTVVRLEENDPDLVRLFLRLLEEGFCGGRAPRTNRAIGVRILELANLFSQIENSPKDVIGLWGELQVICEAASRENATRCWCQQSNAKYDFICDGFALEVKSTLKPRREHRFSLDQLRPSSGDLEVFIASLQLVQAQGGKAVFELIDEILADITDVELRMAFLSLCLAKGGSDIYRSNLRFQLLARDAGIAYFAATDIPVPVVEPSGQISNVRFDVCLDAIKPQTGAQRDCRWRSTPLTGVHRQRGHKRRIQQL